jgi:hypothetical protein
MTDSAKVKSSAFRSYEAGKIPEAFEILWPIGQEGFLKYATRESSWINKFSKKKEKKTNWLLDPKSAAFFWQDFLLREKVLAHLSFSDDLIHTYFSKYGKPEKAFLLALLNQSPEKFVRGVRLNEAYLKPQFQEILQELTLPAELRLHQKLWAKLAEEEQSSWIKIDREITKIENLPADRILAQLVISVESLKFKNSDQDHLSHLGSVYGFIIELLLSRTEIKIKFDNQDFSETGFSKTFFNELKTFHELEENRLSIFPVWAAVSKWVHLKTEVLDAYSFSPEKAIKEIASGIFLSGSPELRYKWLEDGLRYHLNFIRYYFKGLDLVELLEKEKSDFIPKGRRPGDYELNKDLATRKWASVLHLKDLGIDNIRFKDKTELPTFAFLGDIMAFSFNRLMRYEKTLSDKASSSRNWQEAFISTWLEGLELSIRMVPFVSLTESELIQLIQSQPNSSADLKLGERYMEVFSYRATKFEFDRFNPKFNPYLKPFLQVGNGVFCPAAFFSSNLWFYSMEEFMIKISNPEDTRSQSKNVEQILFDRFDDKGFNVTAPLQDTYQGDVDLLVEDDNYILLIQVKRPELRLSPKARHYEQVNVDSKAFQQLIDAEKDFSGSKKQVIKWVISSSFEGVMSERESVLKVNYFDLLTLLDDPEINTIEKLIVAGSRDFAFSNLVSKLQKLEIDHVDLVSGLPLPLFDSKSYFKFLACMDTDRYHEYENAYNVAMGQALSFNPIQAVAGFKDCLQFEPNDGECWGSIANELTNLRLFEEAFNCFGKALELLPNDPFILNNYSGALWESGKIGESAQVLQWLVLNFPLIDQFNQSLSEMKSIVIEKGLLNGEEFLKIFDTELR